MACFRGPSATRTPWDVEIHRIRTPKPTRRPKRENGNLDLPTGTLTARPPEPPAGPSCLYANLLRFSAPGPQKPHILPCGSKPTLPAAAGRPPATPGASWRPAGHPPAPGCKRPDKTRHFRHMRPRFPDSVADCDERGHNWPVKTRHVGVPGRLNPPLARETSNLRSESDVFYHAPFCRVAPFAGGSALHVRILDSVGEFRGARKRGQCAR